MKKLGILSVLLVLVLASVAFAVAPVVQITQVKNAIAAGELNVDVNVGELVQLNAQGLDQADGDAVNIFSWTIKQGANVIAVYNIQNPIHTFAGRGVFTVEVLATDAAGEVSAVADTVTVTARQADLKIKDKNGAELSEIKLSAQDGNHVQYNNLVKLVNEGNIDFNGLKVRTLFDTDKNGVIDANDVPNKLIDKNEDIITVTLNPAVNINVLKNDNALNGLDEVPVSLTLNIGDGFDVSDYKEGKFQVLDAQGNPLVISGRTIEIPFKLRAGEAFCIAGPQQAARLAIDINDPESDNELNIGEKFKVSVEVENNANTDEDFFVEGSLYNLNKGKKVDRFKTKSKSIDSGDKDTFDFEMELDPTEVDNDNDKVVLYLKIFAEDKEEQLCTEKEVKLKLLQEKTDVKFSELTLLPQTVACGAPVEARVAVRNFGSEDTDTVIKLISRELGLDLRSPSFNLDKLRGNKDNSDDTKTLRFNFVLPENVKPGQYNIEADALFNGKDNSITQPLTVTECKKEVVAPKAEEPKVPTVTVTTTTPAVTQPVTQQPTNTNVAPTVFTQSDIFDVFNRDRTPAALWIALDLVLVLLIVIVVYMVVNKRKR